MIHDSRLIEKLAAIEHDQWIEWARTIEATENISPARRKRWSEYYVPYEQLSEDVKEHDRVWARKVLEAINNS